MIRIHAKTELWRTLQGKTRMSIRKLACRDMNWN